MNSHSPNMRPVIRQLDEAAVNRIAAGEGLSAAQAHIAQNGHSIELRICAEDATQDFRPAIGDILLLDEPRGEGVRVDSGILDGGKVTTDFDPMLSKLIVHGRNRAEAIARGRRAAQDYVILGVTTNLAYLDTILDHPKFRSGDVSTGFLAEEADELNQDRDPATTDILAAATVLSDARLVKALENVPEIYRLMGNWRN